jgi:hypothetical protein
LLTSEPEDLTVIHTQSGLPTEHDSRHTDDGFWIDLKRLPNCVALLSAKKPRGSWIWEQGHGLGVNKNNDIVRYWLCEKCYGAGLPVPRSSFLIKAEKNTTKVIDHLEKLHGFDREGNIRPSKKRKASNLYDTWSRQRRLNDTVFDEARWKSAYVKWVVCSGISLCEASSKYHNELLAYHNPQVEGILPTCHTTTSKWILQAYEDAKPKVS